MKTKTKIKLAIWYTPILGLMYLLVCVIFERFWTFYRPDTPSDKIIVLTLFGLGIQLLSLIYLLLLYIPI